MTVDTFQAFLDSDRIIRDPAGSVRLLTHLLPAYAQWSHEHGHPRPTEHGLKETLTEHGVTILNVHTKAAAQGVRLSPTALKALT